MPTDQTGQYVKYYSRAANEAATVSSEFAEATERSSLEHAAYFLLNGDTETAVKMLTRTLGESLMGNEGI